MATNNQTRVTVEPGKQEFFIEREFEAPRELVFRAFAEPDLVEQWLGPNELTCKIIEPGSTEGSRWRFIHTDSDGNEYAFNGVVHEITAPERIIRTFEFEGLPERGHVSLEILTLEALPGERTRMKAQSVFRSVEDRDGMAAGMGKGVEDSYNTLDALLEGLKKGQLQ